MDRLDFLLGILAGVGVVAILCLVIWLVLRRKGRDASRRAAGYDERQERARGRAFQAGFFTMLIGCAAAAVLSALGVPLLDSYLGYVLALYLGAAVFACVSIHLDAYYRLSDRPRQYMILFGVCGLLNLGVALGDMGGGLYRNGRPAMWTVNLGCAAVMAAILLCQLIHTLRRRREAEEDET